MTALHHRISRRRNAALTLLSIVAVSMFIAIAYFGGTYYRVGLFALAGSIVGATISLVGGYEVEIRRERRDHETEQKREERAEQRQWRQKIDELRFDALIMIENAIGECAKISANIVAERHTSARDERLSELHHQMFESSYKMRTGAYRVGDEELWKAVSELEVLFDEVATGLTDPFEKGYPLRLGHTVQSVRVRIDKCRGTLLSRYDIPS